MSPNRRGADAIDSEAIARVLSKLKDDLAAERRQAVKAEGWYQRCAGARHVLDMLLEQEGLTPAFAVLVRNWRKDGGLGRLETLDGTLYPPPTP